MHETSRWVRRAAAWGLLSGLTACSGADASVRGSSDAPGASVESADVAAAAAAIAAPSCRNGKDGVFQGDVYSGEEFGGIVDLTGITEITGSAYLSTRPEVLATATCLRRVDGDFNLQRESSNQDVTNLHGLESLERVDGS